MTANPILLMLMSLEWDAPFFKRLAHNDTARARGHQGGIVIPKDLRRYFPMLDEGIVSPANPVVDRRLRVEIYVGTRRIGVADTRYQYQTWGGTRQAESRLTENLAPLRKEADAGDLLAFQRRRDAYDTYRLVLVRKADPANREVEKFVQTRRWGALFEADPPVTQDMIEEVEAEISRAGIEPFQARRPVVRGERPQWRAARDAVFRRVVGRQYEFRCVVSGILLATPARLHEVEAAHIISVAANGPDDVRNGITLTRTLHWAFDKGLFGIGLDNRILLPRKVKTETGNEYLKQFDGKQIAKGRNAAFCPHPEALEWHRVNRLEQWN